MKKYWFFGLLLILSFFLCFSICPQSNEEQVSSESAPLRLKGIIFSEDNPKAIVNKRVLMKGDTIKGYRVIEIKEDSVTLSSDGDEFELNFKSPSLDIGEIAREIKEKAKDTISLGVNSMLELDFKTKSEIYRMRKKYVSQYPTLVDKNYQPSKDVFEQIEDKKPWWGILGLYYYGAGKKSIMGDSEESRFLVNPFLLVGLDEGVAYTASDKRLMPKAIYPRPLTLIWSKDRLSAKVTYTVSDFWREKERYSYPDERTFHLVAYNARDFGFNYLYVDPDKSKNIISLNTTGADVLIKQYLHRGNSCGYSGGCNNMSPDQSNLRVKAKAVPAEIYIKLWKDKPEDINGAADMVFTIRLL